MLYTVSTAYPEGEKKQMIRLIHLFSSSVSLDLHKCIRNVVDFLLFLRKQNRKRR